jgi:hypothetical protein
VVNFPGSLDTTGAGTLRTNHADGVSEVIAAAFINDLATATVAVETKIGSGSSTPIFGTVLTGTGTGTSTWAAPTGSSSGGTGTFPVESYGAIINGSTDDTGAWSNAIAAATAAGGGTITMGRGTSIVTRISIAASNIYIRGSGAGVSVIKEKNAGNRTQVYFNGASTISNVGISDITIDGNAANQTILSVAYGGTGWTATYGSAFSESFGLSCVQFVDCTGVTVKNCLIQNGLNYGVNAIGCTDVDISHNRFVDATQMRTRQTNGSNTSVGCNTIAITSNTGYGTRKSIRVIGNTIQSVADVGIDIHGNGANYVTVADNILYGQEPVVLGANNLAYWGIALEMEAADGVDNLGATIHGNYVADLNIAYVCNNNLNTSHSVVNQTWTGNVGYNCGTFFQPEGQYVTFSGNTGIAMASGVSMAQVTVNQTNAYMTFVGNTIQINVDGFGTTGFLFRVQNSAWTLRDIIIDSNTVTGVLGTNGYHAGVVLESNFAGCTLTRVKVSNNKFVNLAEGVMIIQTLGTVSKIQCLNNDITGMTDAAYGFTGGTPNTLVRGGDVTGNTNSNPMLGGSTPASGLVLSIQDVTGYNDTIATSTPTPTTGAYTTTTFRNATYTVSGGTVSSITVGGAATGRTSGEFWVPAGKAFVVNNTVIPTTFRQTLY